MKLIVIILLLFITLSSVAQQSDSQLAYTYYQNKEYTKAAGLFLQLYERTHASYYLDYHIICLINAKSYEKAEEVLKKYLKADDNNKDFLINLGYIYTQQGKIKKAEEYFNRALKKLIPYANDIHNLANKFRNIREYTWANKTYFKGRELLKQPNAFMLEIGDNYMLERDYDRMCELFLNALEINPGQLNSITSKLNFARSYDVNKNADKILGTRLEQIFRNKTYAPVFDELGVWYALQIQDYKSAFNHAVRLNAQVAGKLHVYLQIAREASGDGKYEISEDAYSRIIQKGNEENPYYYTARKEILDCRYRRFRQTETPETDYKRLAASCTDFLKETGYTNTHADIAVLLSDLYAYRLNLPDSADQILQKGISIRRLDAPTLNLLKSKRADLLTYMNNPWEAVILYTQIEKANPNNNTGYEAKLKKAQLAYFQGDLLWAKAQYDVLKGSTSKLIANDALKMSHFLNTNYEEEGDNLDLQRLAETEYKIYRKKYTEALPILDSLVANATAGIADQASLVKARLLLACFKTEEAIRLLDTLSKNSPQTYIQAEALYEVANLKALANARQEALELYKILVSDYSGSVYSIEAGKRYRELEKANRLAIPSPQ